MILSNNTAVAPGHLCQSPGEIRKSDENRFANPKLTFFCASVLILSLFTGCKNLRPVQDLTRYYVLSAADAPAATHSNQTLGIGIAPVEISPYLQNGHIVVRRGANEIHYSEYYEWAEHLDKGIQRALAADLSALMPSARVVTSSWQSGEVKVEINVSIQRFELDERGAAVLDCKWLVSTVAPPRTTHFKHSVIVKNGPALASNPAGAIGSLSDALVDLSKEIAGAVNSIP